MRNQRAPRKIVGGGEGKWISRNRQKPTQDFMASDFWMEQCSSKSRHTKLLGMAAHISNYRPGKLRQKDNEFEVRLKC